MARLRATNTKGIKYHSIIEDYYRNGKRTTRTLVTLGSDNKISELAKSQNMFYNKIEKDFNKSKNDEINKLSEYKKYLIPKENEKEKNYQDIKEKLQKQEEQIKKLENEKKENNNITNDVDNDNGIKEDIEEENIEDDKYLNLGTGDEDVDKLLNEIKMADLQMDSYLKDIDECLEMNENIEKHLDNEEKEGIEKEKEEQKDGEFDENKNIEEKNSS